MQARDTGYLKSSVTGTAAASPLQALDFLLGGRFLIHIFFLVFFMSNLNSISVLGRGIHILRGHITG